MRIRNTLLIILFNFGVLGWNTGTYCSLWMPIWSFDSIFAYVFRIGIVGWKLNWGFDGYCGLSSSNLVHLLVWIIGCMTIVFCMVGL